MNSPIDIIDQLPRHPTKKYDRRPVSAIKRIVIHTTNRKTTPQWLAKYDVTPYFFVGGQKVFNHISNTGCPAITYHEGVMENGLLYTTLDWREVAWHAGNHNKTSLGIALYYKAEEKDGDLNYPPSPKMMRTLVERCSDICLQLGLTPDKVVGHRELKGTGWFMYKGSRKLRKTCPGVLLDLGKLRHKVARLMQSRLKLAGLYDGAIDCDFGKMSQEALRKWRV